MILQFANYLSEIYRQQGHEDVEVYADAWLSLNGRRHRRLIDPTVNLAKESLSLQPAQWITRPELNALPLFEHYAQSE